MIDSCICIQFFRNAPAPAEVDGPGVLAIQRHHAGAERRAHSADEQDLGHFAAGRRPARRCFRATRPTRRNGRPRSAPGCPVNVSRITLVAARGRPRGRAAALRRRGRGHRRARPGALPRPLPRDPCDRQGRRWCCVSTSRMRCTSCRRGCWCAPTSARRWTAGIRNWPPSRRKRSSSWPRSASRWWASTRPASIPAQSKDLPSHQAIRRLGLRVLENLVLDEVPEGDYELIALPLKLMTADASPVRAVLRALQPRHRAAAS